MPATTRGFHDKTMDEQILAKTHWNEMMKFQKESISIIAIIFQDSKFFNTICVKNESFTIFQFEIFNTFEIVDIFHYLKL